MKQMLPEIRTLSLQRERERERGNVVSVVYSTYDYDKFKVLKGNRTVESGRRSKIRKSILEVGWIMNPIIVNENYEIIEGAGRFTILRELGKPIEYIIVSGLGLKECIALNQSSTTWTSYDYIKSFAEKGNDNYKKLLNLESVYYPKNPKKRVCSINTIGVICFGMVGNGGNGGATQRIKMGEFELSTEREYEVIDLLNFLAEEDVCKYIKMANCTTALLQTCITWSLEHTDATKDGFMIMLRNCYTGFKPYTKVDDVLGLIQTFYNENKSGSQRVDFLNCYEEYRKRNNSNRRK